MNKLWNVVIYWLCVFGFVLPSSAFAGELLKSVDFSTAENGAQIKINLGPKFDYITHFPSTRGKIIQIQLGVKDPAFTEADLKRRETIQPDASAPAGLRDVIFEGNVRGGPYLVLRFTNVVVFTVEKVKGGQSLTVGVQQELAAVAPTAPVADGEKTGKADELLRTGKDALTRGDNSAAILLFSQLLELPENPNTEAGKEFMGVARERSGQLEIAKKVYDEYLLQYPKSARLDTVRQRLMALNARLAEPKETLKEGKRQVAERTGVETRRVELFGRVSQLYYGAWNSPESGSFSQTQNMVQSFFDVTRRVRDDVQESRFVFSGNHTLDFSAASSSSSRKSSDFRVRSVYFDYKAKRGVSASVGRQSVNSGGVLGRFDGVVGGYRLSPKWQVNGVLGVPVDFADNLKFQTNRPMYGIRFDADDVVPRWKGSFYGIKQDVDGIVDRMAVGGDARYFFEKKIFYALLDYDVSYKVLNFATAHYGWQMNEGTKFDFHVDKRLSPVMLTTSALSNTEKLGGLDQLKLDEIRLSAKPIRGLIEAGVTEDELRERAVFNSGDSTLLTLGLTRDLRKDLNFNGTFSVSTYTAPKQYKPATVNEPTANREIVETPPSRDYTLSGQFMLRDFWRERAVWLLGGRLSKSTDYDRYQVSAQLRAPYKDQWTGDARLRASYDTNKGGTASAGSTYKLSPGFRAEYRWNKDMSVEGEATLEIARGSTQGADSVWSSVNIGYRYQF